jgi:rfaE bifunctional protein kinase chain/domain
VKRWQGENENNSGSNDMNMDQLLDALLNRFTQSRVLVIGDSMLDQYIWGNVTRFSPEAAVPIIKINKTTYSPGGAANVVANILSLQGKAYFTTVVGDDAEGQKLQEWCVQNQLDLEGIYLDTQRPTTLKSRIFARHRQYMRLDRENCQEIDHKIEQRILRYVRERIGNTDVVLFSDYAKGLVTPNLLASVIELAKRDGIPVIVDPKGSDFTCYKGVTLITPNWQEALAAIAKSPETSIQRVGKQLLDMTNCEWVLITQGAEGMSLFNRDGFSEHLPAVAKEVHDVTGAGDTVVSSIALCMASQFAMFDCIKIANLAAGIVVNKMGTSVVTIEEISKNILKHDYLFHW